MAVRPTAPPPAPTVCRSFISFFSASAAASGEEEEEKDDEDRKWRGRWKVHIGKSTEMAARARARELRMSRTRNHFSVGQEGARRS